MHINDVENIVGLSKKSIRYYEKMNLVKPIRNSNNDYREYNEEDINKLRLIKFLRELDVPIKELQDLESHQLSLQECMSNRLTKINEEENKIKSIKNMCEEIVNNKEEFKQIDITKYYQTIRILNKEGFTMHKIKTNNTKKIIGAIISSSIFEIFFITLLGFITYIEFQTEDKAPIFVYILFVIILGIPILSIIYSLILRIKEIKGGEEDEASKY